MGTSGGNFGVLRTTENRFALPILTQNDGLSIFRAVVVAWLGYPNVPTICASRVAPVAESTGAACFPTDAIRVPPDREPAPDDYAPSRPCGSSAQIALGSASAVAPTAVPVCQSDSHALARSAMHSPKQPEPDRPLGRRSRQTN